MPMINRPSRQPQPKNRGVAHIARSSLDKIIPLAQEQYDNALSVNSSSVLFYRKKNSGLRCSCSVVDAGSDLPNALPEEPGVQVLRPDGSGTETYLSSMLNGAAIKIERYGSRTHDPNNPQRAAPHSPLVQGLNVINKSGSLSDPLAEEVEPFDTEDLFGGGLDVMNEALLAANADSGCGVCMGTNWVGGYELLNGYRVVLDAQARYETQGIEVDNMVHPNRFNVGATTGGSWWQFEITLPLGAISVDVIRLWNDKVQLNQGLRFEIYEQGQWLELTEDRLLANCDGVEHAVRVLLTDETITTFTHVEIQLDLGAKPLYIDWPQQSQSQDLRQPENMDPVQIVISPYVPAVDMFDIVAETIYDRKWLITQVTNQVDRTQNVLGWQAGARLVQRLEFASLLFVRRKPHQGDQSAKRRQVIKGEGNL